MPMRHIGDTAERPRLVGDLAALEPHRRRWSRFRAVSFGVCLVATSLFVLALFGGHQGPIEPVSNAVLEALGVACALSLSVTLAAWGYEVVAPKAWQRLAALHESQRELHTQLDELREQISDLSEAINVYGGDKRQDGYEAALRDTGYRMPAHNMRKGERPILVLHNERQAQRRQTM